MKFSVFFSTWNIFRDIEGRRLNRKKVNQRLMRCKISHFYLLTFLKNTKNIQSCSIRQCLKLIIWTINRAANLDNAQSQPFGQIVMFNILTMSWTYHFGQRLKLPFWSISRANRLNNIKNHPFIECLEHTVRTELFFAKLHYELLKQL